MKLAGMCGRNSEAHGNGSRCGLIPLLLVSACGGGSVPDPRGAAEQYARAVASEDERALHALLDEESRRAIGQERIGKLLAQSRGELERRAKELAGPDAEVNARAELQLSDGEVVSLELEDGQFRVSSALAFPSGATTPVQALRELRSALAQRSYVGLLHVLSSDTRVSLEEQLQDLVLVLERPEALEVNVEGDRATVTTPRGHRVELQNEDGIWKVRDFE